MSPIPLRSKSVLVVDDSSTIRSAVRVSLAGFEDLELRFATDGFGALTEVGRLVPDMILMDVLMPRLSGYLVAALIKQNPKTASIPLYMLTSKDGEVDKAMGRLRGVDGYLVKPFPKEVIRSLVQQVLGLCHQSKEAELVSVA